MISTRNATWIERAALVMLAPVLAIIFLAALLLVDLVVILLLPVFVVIFVLAVIFGEIRISKYIKGHPTKAEDDASDLKW